MHVEVIRAFPGSEPEGSVMDTEGWPPNRAHQLIKRRFVAPVLTTVVQHVSDTPVAEPRRRGPGRPRKAEVAQP